MKDKRKKLTSRSEGIESKDTLKNLKKIKTLDLGDAQGFTCDAETGICGPVTQEKEGNE